MMVKIVTTFESTISSSYNMRAIASLQESAVDSAKGVCGNFLHLKAEVKTIIEDNLEEVAYIPEGGI